MTDYKRLDYYEERHLDRYKQYVSKHGLSCQECYGCGRVAEDNIDGWTLWGICGWCEGTGLVTKWLRGQWLKYKREYKRKR